MFINPLLKDILTIRRPTFEASTVDVVEALLKKYIGYANRDEDGNFIYKVGDVGSNVVFMCHYDTVEVKTGYKKLYVNPFKKTVRVFGGGVLGADCGAGVYLMIRMIKANISGHYAFFSEEEQGRVGSMACMIRSENFENCSKAISFDRRGYSDVITHQMGNKCCSSIFSEALVATLNQHIRDYPLYETNPNGGYTDSYCFNDVIKECTNISVGYFNEHQETEFLDYRFLDKLLYALCMIDWSSLPVEDQINDFSVDSVITIQRKVR
jgi:acetylornithine deacetylase/succinyl-diaminopimelate desuccinylase-like protein